MLFWLACSWFLVLLYNVPVHFWTHLGFQLGGQEAPKTRPGLDLEAPGGVQDMKKSKLIDKIIKEPLGGAHQNRQKMFTIVGNEITKSFLELDKLSSKDLINFRRTKFENMGVFKS